MRWSDFNLTPIADVSTPREMIEETDNAIRNDRYEELRGQAPDVQAFAADWNREADEARERSLQEREES